MSQRIQIIIGALVLMGITAVVSVLGYNAVVGGSGAPSGTLSAPTLALPTSDPRVTQIAELQAQVTKLQAQNQTALAPSQVPPSATPNGLVTQIAQLQAQIAQLQAENATLSAANQAAVVVPTLTSTPLPTATTPPTATPIPPTATTPPPTTTPETTAAVQAAGAAAVYRIVADNSEVRFILTEELRGVPTTVTGKTNQVAGDILIDPAAPANSKIGLIRINARTLATDNEFRNQAIRSRILQSSRDEFEFIEFNPTAISGLPATVAAGQDISFKVTGDLKIRNIVKSVTFDVTAKLSDTQLEGKAKTGVKRGDFDLQIPSAPGVANVAEDVQLEIDFVATKVQQ
jgi:polyisoprenoid-binding protein YceI/cell division protein FtsB